jgi:hypothetical protein
MRSRKNAWRAPETCLVLDAKSVPTEALEERE